MTAPTILDLYELVRAKGREVSFIELMAAFPYAPRVKIRNRCARLVQQGYLKKVDSTDSYIYVGD